MSRSKETLVWDDARIFLALAREGSLSHAAAALGIGVATVSRRIERLEDVIGAPLFTRHPTGYRLTDEGETLVDKARAAESAMTSFGATGAAVSGLAGRVTLATAEKLAADIIIPALPAFLADHPELSLEIITDVAAADLDRRDADLALRLIKPTHGNVKTKRVGKIGFGLYCAGSYLDRRHDGEMPSDLSYADFVGWADAYAHLDAARWINRTLQGRRPVLTASSLDGIAVAAANGVGFGILPHFLGRKLSLIRAQRDGAPLELGIDRDVWLVMHADLAGSRRVREVADFLTRLMKEQQPILSGEREP